MFVIVADNLSKAYGSKVAVKDFSLTVSESEVVALLGGAGAGKSTILKMIAADVKPDAGTVSVGGYDTVLQAGHVRPLIGVVKHERFLEPNLTGRENMDEQALLRFLTSDEGERRVAELLVLTDLGARADAPTRTYTTDEWAQLEMAACLVHRPKLLIVDEPTRGCDEAGRAKVWATFHKLRAQVVSVLFTTPDATEAQALGGRVVKL